MDENETNLTDNEEMTGLVEPDEADELNETAGPDESAELYETAGPDEAAELYETAVPDEAAELEDKLYQVKTEYKKLKRDQRKKRLEERRKREGERSRVNVGLTVLISAASFLLCFILVALFIFLFPSADKSLFSSLVKKYAAEYNARSDVGGRISIDGNTADKGSDITINVDGEFSSAAAFAKASQSVVSIYVSKVDENGQETGVSLGSGIIVSEDGEILTNNHMILSVVNNETRSLDEGVTVYVYVGNPDNEPYATRNLIGYDADVDLALIKIDKSGLTPVEFGDSDNLSVGEPVLAIGTPLALEYMNSVCDGVISGLKRVAVSSSTGSVLYDMIQFTAPINPGNSGGAVVNRKGELVGISVMKIVIENYENMAFAISSNVAARAIDSFRKYGRYIQPKIGITVDTTYFWQKAKENEWPLGAYVAEVSENGPAQKAGIIAGDIICEIGGNTVLNFTELKTNLIAYDPDAEFTVKVFRTSDRKYYDFTVKLNAS